jgi:hypothetical protein
VQRQRPVHVKAGAGLAYARVAVSGTNESNSPCVYVCFDDRIYVC